MGPLYRQGDRVKFSLYTINQMEGWHDEAKDYIDEHKDTGALVLHANLTSGKGGV